MKKLIMIAVAFIISTTVGWAQSVGISWTEPSNQGTRTLLITPQTSKQYLDSVSTAWKKDSIDLTFSKLIYNSSDRLVKIKGSVICTYKGKQSSGTFESDNLDSYEIKAGKGVSITGK